MLALVGANVYLERVICSLLMDNLEGGYDLTVGPLLAKKKGGGRKQGKHLPKYTAPEVKL